MIERAANLGTRQNDMMLWIAAGAIGAIGLAWLLMSQLGGSTREAGTPLAAPTASADRDAADRRTPSESPAAATAGPTDASSTGLSTDLDDPLRAAQMAFEAGMLIEPEAYSAWALFAAALEAAPDNDSARAGLEQVAAALLERGTAAHEQGRYADAEAIADRILGRLPEHEGALELQQAIEKERSRRASRPASTVEPPAITVEEGATAGSAPIEPPAVTPESTESATAASQRDEVIAELHSEFIDAVASNRLLAPDDDSAKRYLQTMLETDPDHEQTLEAHDWLITEMLNRSRQSSEATDWDAARTWIDEAEALGADAVAVAEHRVLLTERRIEAESQKRLPASALEVRKYVPPDYPRLARSRNTEGWVDVEFTLTTAGTTRDVRVVDGSNERLFHAEATDAVSQWEFEPRLFLGQPIEQLVYTRVRFVFDD